MRPERPHEMLTVEVARGKEGDILGFRARGHTGFATHGKDIVCAGASAVLHTAVLGVVRHAGLPARVKADEGYLELWLEAVPGEQPPADPARWQRAQAVLEAAVLGLGEMARQYPKHVRLEVRRPAVQGAPFERGPRPEAPQESERREGV